MPPGLYKTRMKAATNFIESLHYVPEGAWSSGAFSVLRAGKLVASPDYASSAPPIPARTSSIAFRAPAASGRWGNDWRRKPVNWSGSPMKSRMRILPTPASPWTLLWFRLDGPNLPAVRKRLFGGARRGSQCQATPSSPPGLTGFFPPCAAANSARTSGSISSSANSSSSSTAADRFERIGRARIACRNRRGDEKAPGATMDRRPAGGGLGSQRIANPATIQEAPARKPSRMATTRAVDLRAIAYDQWRRQADRNRRDMRLLRRLSLHPGIQTRGRGLPRRMAARRIERTPKRLRLDSPTRLSATRSAAPAWKSGSRSATARWPLFSAMQGRPSRRRSTRRSLRAPL